MKCLDCTNVARFASSSLDSVKPHYCKAHYLQYLGAMRTLWEAYGINAYWIEAISKRVNGSLGLGT